MRISVNDPSWHPGMRVSVFLDGKEYTKCITADEEQGYIVVYKEPLSWNEDSGSVETEVLYGKVEIMVLDE